MAYSTRTYIAADWDHDGDAVDKLHQWNDNNYWSLSFTDAHDLTQAKDSSLNCSIEASLKKRLDASKRFVLIVGEHTNTVTAGSCQWCKNYSSSTTSCDNGRSVDFRSYIKYECDKAVEAGMAIVILYKSVSVKKSKCPEAVRYEKIHVPMYRKGDDGKVYWNYSAVKKAFDDTEN